MNRHRFGSSSAPGGTRTVLLRLSYSHEEARVVPPAGNGSAAGVESDRGPTAPVRGTRLSPSMPTHLYPDLPANVPEPASDVRRRWTPVCRAPPHAAPRRPTRARILAAPRRLPNEGFPDDPSPVIPHRATPCARSPSFGRGSVDAAPPPVPRRDGCPLIDVELLLGEARSDTIPACSNYTRSSIATAESSRLTSCALSEWADGRSRGSSSQG